VLEGGREGRYKLGGSGALRRRGTFEDLAWQPLDNQTKNTNNHITGTLSVPHNSQDIYLIIVSVNIQKLYLIKE
jgi:hypothetical protein